ncbi:MAG TPA: class A beta-lactamase, subclass A2 [Pyrinomonadaceae bacterium]|jgi:beta-lactamase class A
MLKALILIAATLSLNCSHTATHTQEAVNVSQPAASTAASPTASPNKLREQMEQIATGAGGRVGAAVLLIETGETVALNGEQRFPMQSVYKLPIAMAVLRQVDEGVLRLEQKVRVEKEDLVGARLHSPLRDGYPRGTELSLENLLRFAISQSDGTASDVLMRLAGGPDVVMKYLHELGVNGLVVVNTEKELGQDQSLQYQNWAAPESVLVLLRALQEGRGLSAESRALLLRLMTETPTGPKRLKGRLPAGTVVAHKTGTSGTVEGLTAATNDVGLLTLPDGRHLAVAVFVSDSRAGESVREDVIAQIARAAWDWSTQPR